MARFCEGDAAAQSERLVQAKKAALWNAERAASKFGGLSERRAHGGVIARQTGMESHTAYRKSHTLSHSSRSTMR